MAEAAPVPAPELEPVSPSSLPPAQDDAASGDLRSISVYVGLRQLDEDDWEPIEEPLVVGVEYVAQEATAMVGYEAGFSYSTDDDDASIGGLSFDVESEVFELYAGVHKSFFGSARLRPYVGAGLTFLQGNLEVSGGGGSADEDDEVFGVYVHGGLGFALGESLEAGVDVRTIFADDFDFNGTDAKADYAQASAFLGFRI